METLLLKDLVEELAFSDRARGLSSKTIKKHGKILSLFLRFLEEKNVDSLGMVTVSHARGFLIKNIEEGKAESYVNSHLRSIRAFFRYCVDENYMREKENPCLYVKWVKERQVIINTFKFIKNALVQHIIYSFIPIRCTRAIIFSFLSKKNLSLFEFKKLRFNIKVRFV